MTERITESIGIDLGDRYSAFCVVDQATGEEVESGRVPTTPEALARLLGQHPTARVAMETGTHSPWASRVAEAHCAEVLVANARELRFIFGSNRKCDDLDARTLARVARMDPALLYPIRHRGETAQRDLALVRARDAVVRARTKLVNSVGGIVKSWGARMPKQAAKSVGHGSLERVPEPLRDALEPMLCTIERLTEEIRTYDRQVELLAKERYPETAVLAQVPGVGSLTALAYVLTLEAPERFRRSRDVGAYLGLVPRRDQSGETEKELRITKAGDGLVRRLLVQCAHYILGRNGPPCDLKRHGEAIAARGGKVAKRKAVIAVARKLAVLLHALWRTGEVYAADQPNRTAQGSPPPRVGRIDHTPSRVRATAEV